MTCTAIIIKKDLWRHRRIIGVWLAVLLLKCLFNILAITVFADNIIFQIRYPEVMDFFMFLDWILAFVFIPLIVHEDPVVGTKAFWLTRPISRTSLLSAKTVMVLGVFLVLPLLLEMIILLLHGFPGSYCVLAIPEIIMMRALMIIPMFFLACVTPKFSRYALTAVLLMLAAFIFYGFWTNVIWKKYAYAMDLNAKLHQGLFYSIQVVHCLLIIFLGAALIMYQYLTRQTKRVILAAICGYILIYTILVFWRWNFIGENTAFSPEAMTQQKFKRPFNQKLMKVKDEVKSGKRYEREMSFNMHLEIPTLKPKQFLIFNEIKDAKIHYPDGRVSPSFAEQQPFSSFSLEHKALQSPMQYALNDYLILNPPQEKLNYDEIYHVSENVYTQLKNKRGTYRAEVLFVINEYAVSSIMPLKVGAHSSFGPYRQVIYDVQLTQKGLSVFLGEKHTNVLFWQGNNNYARYHFYSDYNSDYGSTYLVSNRVRGEAFMIDLKRNYNTKISKLSWGEGGRLTTKVKRLDYDFTYGQTGGSSLVDEAWLKGAELIRLDAIEVGTLKADVEYQDFFLPER